MVAASIWKLLGVPRSGAARVSPETGGPAPKRRFSQAIDRSPKVGTLAVSFGAYLLGSLLLIVSVFLIIPGLLLLLGSMGSGWQGRVTGVALVVVGTAALVAGRWLSDQYAVY